MIAIAAPAYLAARGVPRTHHDLKHHHCLLGFTRGELPDTHWPMTSGSKLHVEGTFFSNDITLLCEAAVAGLGIALLPQDLVARDLERGALQQVLADVVGTELHIALVYPDRTFLPPQVRAFIDAVVAWVPRRRAVEPGAPTSGQLAASRGSRKQGAAS